MSSFVRRYAAPQWFEALTLAERAAGLRGAAVDPHAFDEVRADRRLKRWRSHFATIGASFEQRLALDCINERALHRLLGEPSEALRARSGARPGWLARLAHTYRGAYSRDQAVPFVDRCGSPLEYRLLVAIAPLLEAGLKRLRRAIRAVATAHEALPFDEQTIEAIVVADWARDLFHLLARTLVLEMYAAGQQGLLVGDTPEQRFDSFVQRLRQPEVAYALLEEYPVLARHILTDIDNRVRFGIDFVEHLCADWERLQGTLGLDGKLVQLEGSQGDRHRGGRSVLIATFGSGRKVVYKPKPLGADAHFQELLAWLNRHGACPSFRIHQVIDRGAYGWVEYVPAFPCRTRGELDHFYRRQGTTLALLYALGATDFHFENLVAAGGDPVLVDMEALFHPPVQRAEGEDVDQLVIDRLLQSVLKVGLLPMRLWFNGQSEGLDISGLWAPAGQLSPDPIPCWEGTGTDQMRLAHRRLPLKQGHHRPSLAGVEVRPIDYLEPLVAGFTTMYRLLLAHRDALLADDGPLRRFRQDTMRVILRPSRFYASLLYDSYHPEVLRDAMDRDLLFDRLWCAVAADPKLARIISLEREQLLQGDIPVFTTCPGSRDLWSSSGARVADFFDESTAASIERRLLQFGEHDLERQIWYIRASLATTAPSDERIRTKPYVPAKFDGVSRDQLLAASMAVGDRLHTLCLRSGRSATWVGLSLVDERNWTLASAGLDLYSGLPGIALYLAYLGAVTGVERYTAIADDAVETLRRQVWQAQHHVTSVGAFTGWAGLIYAFTQLAALWSRPDLTAAADRIVAFLPDLIKRDRQFDIIGGSAGCILALLALHRHAPSRTTIDAAICCGDRLLAKAQPVGPGVAWVSGEFSSRPLSGLSHGAAGIAWALLELSAFSGDACFRSTAQAALAFERTLFSSAEGNWLDQRDVSGNADHPRHTAFMTAWCNGAPGIGLARLRSLIHLDDDLSRDEIAVALRSTLQRGFGGNHSLCHGDLGNLELFMQARTVLNDDEYRARVDQIAASILDSVAQRGWVCGTPQGVETPGLMTGIAGIGWGLLRVAAPERVPAVLLLQGPPTTCEALDAPSQ